MDREDLERILSEALDILYVQAKAIITVDAAERSICARLAAILQRYFEGLSVDTDYNRHGVVPKEIDLPDADGVLTANLVSPDIIVHTPGHDGDNLLVIEAKDHQSPAGRSRPSQAGADQGPDRLSFRGVPAAPRRRQRGTRRCAHHVGVTRQSQKSTARRHPVSSSR